MECTPLAISQNPGVKQAGPLPDSKPAAGISFGVEREVEGLAWDRAQAPFMWDVCATTMGPALRHDVGHTFDSFKSGAT